MPACRISRSRRGCIDCKQAKVKCDEIHPSCGTCARRKRLCRGYQSTTSDPKSPSSLKFVESPVRPSLFANHDFSHVAREDTRPNHSKTTQSMICDELVPAQYHSQTASSSTSDRHELIAMVVDASSISPRILIEPRLLSFEDIHSTDKTMIELYFMRHPHELVMSDEFVHEMNAAVISLLQESPNAVCETLSAIGESYIVEAVDHSLVHVSARKNRLLNRLRKINVDGSSIELILGTMLGLCGVELVESHSNGRGSPLLRLVENIALMLKFHLRPQNELSSTARYFAMALARQDMLISLSRLQRTKIATDMWLNVRASTSADRLWGYTATLAPILADLCALAEDMQEAVSTSKINWITDAATEDNALVIYDLEFRCREATVRSRLQDWHPTHDFSLPLQTARKILSHAHAWKSAALLYLHRLFNRPGTSSTTDQAALGMAYDVLLHISGPAQDIKMSLWPLFMAACEMQSHEDREHVTDLFDKICRARPTVTARRTRSFCIDTIWTARDSGMIWDWMELIRDAENEFIPI